MVRQGGKLFVGIWVVVALLMLPLAASARQDSSSLDILNMVNGTLDTSTPNTTYTFSLDSGFVFSLSAWNRSGDLALSMTLLDESGTIIAEGVPTDDSESTVAVEAITVPEPTTYSVKLSAINGTSGEYGLILIPGYSYIETWDEFEGKDDDFSLTWDVSTDPTETGVVDGQLRVFTDEPNTVTWLAPDEDLAWSDLYLEANVEVEGSPSYFEYGFLVRVSEEDAFYIITVTSDDSWWASYFDGENWTTLLEWTESPVIDTGSDARIGLFVQGNEFTLFFNDKLVGSVTDDNLSAAEGAIALAGATTADQTDTVTVYFDNLIITSPSLSSSSTASGTGEESNGESISGLFGSTGGEATPTPRLPFGLQGATKTPEAESPAVTSTPQPTKEPPQPTKEPPQPTKEPPLPLATPTPDVAAGASLENWNSAQPQALMNELLSLGLVPTGGSLEITVNNSFGDTSSSGFSFYPLAEGRSFQNFVLSFDAKLTMAGAGSGCGMHFRNNPNSRSLAFIMEDGSALLTQVNAGEFHEQTIFDVFPVVNPGVNAVNRVLVIALNETLAMYVNGELIGVVNFNLETGGVALEVYVQPDSAGATQRTYCQLQNVWLWEF